MWRFMSLCLMITTSLYGASTLSKDEEQALLKNFTQLATQEGTLIFTPPKGWRIADPKALPKSVHVMVVGSSSGNFPPSINLGSEEFSGTLQEYLLRVKAINKSQGSTWKDLGKINTEAGEASLSQVNKKTAFGEIKLMHVILKRENTIYIMTASALKGDFSNYYSQFFEAFRSLKFQ